MVLTAPKLALESECCFGFFRAWTAEAACVKVPTGAAISFYFSFPCSRVFDAFSLSFPMESPSPVQAQTALEALKCSFTLAVFPQKREPGLSTTSCIRSANRVRREEVKEEVEEHPLLPGCPAQARLLLSNIPEELWHLQEGSADVSLLHSPTWMFNPQGD